MQGLLFKSATNPLTAPLDPSRIIAHRARAEVISNAIRAGLLGIGVGTSARGVQGLLNQWQRAQSPIQAARKPHVIDIPVPQEEEEEKIAGWQDWVQHPVRKPIEAISKAVLPHSSPIADAVAHPWQTMKDLWSGESATSARSVPFGWLPPLAAGAAGIYGGWKGLDYLLDRSREQELEAIEDRAREEYEEALAAQSKIGQALNTELDTLYDAMGDEREELVKQAYSLSDVFGDASSMYGLYAIASGLVPGIWAYEATKARQRSSLLEKARKKYRRKREEQRPTPVYARPVPVQGAQGSSMKSAPDTEELEGSPLDKAATTGLIMAYAR